MTVKMEEGFKSEQRTRQLAKSETMKGLKDEETARQMVQKDLDILKEVIKSLQMGSGSTVCSEASTGVGLGSSDTFAWPPALASPFSEIFIPRKMGFKGWLTDYKKCSYQGLTATEVSNFIRDLQKMVLDINFTSTVTGIKQGQSKGLGRRRRLSICGSRMRPIWQQ